jgi:FAD/FMN-containing dehydrogenase
MRLRQRFSGPVFLPGDDGYDERRRPLNSALDAHPAIVVEAAGTADVRAAVDAARQFDLPFAVQATGHGTHVPNNAGLLLKTSQMAGVLVDPGRRVARVGPGARWSAVLAAAAPFGLAPLCGSSPDVGVTGYTMGGGLGWLARKFGFAADSVLRAEVVTADGRIMTASPERNPDLFWALCGGGANFGVVTSLEFKLYPVAQVYAGMASFPIERAGEILAFYRDWAAKLPDEMSTAVVLRPTELVVKAMYAGPVSQARKLLRPLYSVAGPAISDTMAPIPFASAAMGGTAARYMDMLPSLPDGALKSLLSVDASNVEIRHWGGAIASGEAPAGHRSAQFSVIIDTPELPESLRAFGIGGSFLNFLADPARVPSAYTAVNFQRLREVKATWDPFNFFRVNHNIPPSRAHRRAASQKERGMKTKTLLACGVIAGPLFTLTVILQELTREGFDPKKHPLSLLSLGDLGWLQITNFVVSGILALASAFGLRRALRGSRAGTWGPILIGVYGIGLIWGGVFVADPAFGYPVGTPDSAPEQLSWHGALHAIAPATASIALFIACLVFARRFLGEGARGWTAYSIVSAVLSVALTSMSFPLGDYRIMFVGGVIVWLWAAIVTARISSQTES